MRAEGAPDCCPRWVEIPAPNIAPLSQSDAIAYSRFSAPSEPLPMPGHDISLCYRALTSVRARPMRIERRGYPMPQHHTSPYLAMFDLCLFLPQAKRGPATPPSIYPRIHHVSLPYPAIPTVSRDYGHHPASLLQICDGCRSPIRPSPRPYATLFRPPSLRPCANYFPE